MKTRADVEAVLAKSGFRRVQLTENFAWCEYPLVKSYGDAGKVVARIQIYGPKLELKGWLYMLGDGILKPRVESPYPDIETFVESEEEVVLFAQDLQVQRFVWINELSPHRVHLPESLVEAARVDRGGLSVLRDLLLERGVDVD